MLVRRFDINLGLYYLLRRKILLHVALREMDLGVDGVVAIFLLFLFFFGVFFPVGIEKSNIFISVAAGLVAVL